MNQADQTDDLTSVRAEPPTTPAEARSAPAEPRKPAASKPAFRVPRVIWWITGLHVTLLLAYSALLPTYRAPDEPFHVDLAHVFSEEMRYPAWDEAEMGAGIRRSMQLMQFGQRSANLTTAEAAPKHERPSLETLEGDDEPDGINQQTQHPPLYYGVTGTIMWAIERVAGDPIGSFAFEIWLYRLMSLLFVAPLPFIIWRTGSVLGVPSPVRVAASLVPLAIPQLIHIGSTVTNDSLSMLLFWSLTPVVLRIANGALAPRTAALAGLVTGLGLFTKGYAMVMVVWTGIALGIALVRSRGGAWRAVMTSGAVYAVVAVAAGGWWWIRNLIVYDELTPSRFDQLVKDHPGAGGFTSFLDTWATRTTWRFWGDFGWYDTRLPGPAVVAATALCLALIVVALAARNRTVTSRRSDRALLVMPLVLLMTSQMQVAYSEHQRTSLFPGLQGRYWFGSVAAVAVLVALGLGVLLRGRRSWAPMVVLGGVALMQALALSGLLGFYWGAPGSALVDRVRAVIAWTPLPGELIGLAALAGAVVVGGAVFQVTRACLRPPCPESA